MVNAVAAAVHAENPNFLVETLAYQGSEKPPLNIKPASNVIVRLAPLNRDFGKPFNSPANQESYDNLQAWAAIADHLFFWNYVTNFRHSLMPHPNWPHLATDIQVMQANHVKGVFEQGNAYTNDVGDFNPMRAWIIGKLMWNPTLDTGTLRDEFLSGYYGAAGPYLKQYLQRVQTSYNNIGSRLNHANEGFNFLTLDVMNNATQDFESALQAVQGNAQLTQRVQKERLSLELAWIFRYNYLKNIAGPNGTFWGPSDPIQAIDDYYDHATAFGVVDVGEGRSLASTIPQMKQWFAPLAPLPPFAQPYPLGEVIDIQPQQMDLDSPVATVVTDSNASNNSAVEMLTNVYSWAIQAKLSKFIPAPQRYRVFAMARIETPNGVPATGNALYGGIFDESNSSYAGFLSSPTAASIQGSTYHPVDLGAHDLTPDQFLWLARSDNSNSSALYVDRIILIREVPLPPFALTVPRADIIDFQPTLLSLDSPVATVVTDGNASDGTAAKMTMDVYSWAIQAKLNKFITAPESYRVYLLARVETPGGVPATGSAFYGGIYDESTSSNVSFLTSPSAASIQGSAYHIIDLGVSNFTSSQFIWLTQPGNSNSSALYVDRIILIKEP